jgi:hypothetical protein
MFGLVDAEQHQACFSFISGIVFGVSCAQRAVVCVRTRVTLSSGIIFIAGAALDASLLPFNGPIIPGAASPPHPSYIHLYPPPFLMFVITTSYISLDPIHILASFN